LAARSHCPPVDPQNFHSSAAPMHQVVEVELIDPTGIQRGEPGPDTFEQGSQLAW